MRFGRSHWMAKLTLLFVFALCVSFAPAYAKESSNDAGAIEPAAAPTPVDAANVEQFNITKTALGQKTASEAAARWAAKGVTIDAASLRVYNFGTSSSPDLLVLPPELAFQSSATTQSKSADGHTVAGAQTAIVIDPQVLERAVSAQATPDAVTAASWNMVYNRCLTRKTKYIQNELLGWMDTCYKVHKLANDGNQWRDYWQLEVYATAKSSYPFTLLDASIEAQPAAGSTAMRWLDWSPRSDLDKGSCTAVPLGVSALGVSISSVFSVCDKWDITKFEQDGRFRNSWKGAGWWAWWNIEAEREVAFMQAIWVIDGKTPSWVVYQNFQTTDSG